MEKAKLSLKAIWCDQMRFDGYIRDPWWVNYKVQPFLFLNFAVLSKTLIAIVSSMDCESSFLVCYVAKVAQIVAKSASENDNGLFKPEVIWNSTTASFFYNTNTLRKDCSLDKQSFEMNKNIKGIKCLVKVMWAIPKSFLNKRWPFPHSYSKLMLPQLLLKWAKRKGCKLLDERKEIISYVIPLFKAPQG